jgi:thiol-disulfide isomerase/thioredoxin
MRLGGPGRSFSDARRLGPRFSIGGSERPAGATVRFAGRNILLVFGTSWCPACKSQIGTILKAGPLLQEKGVTVLEVYIKDDPNQITKYLANKQFPVPFHALLDDGRAQRDYRILAIPRVVIIDRDFNVAYDGMKLSGKALAARISQLQAAPANTENLANTMQGPPRPDQTRQ